MYVSSTSTVPARLVVSVAWLIASRMRCVRNHAVLYETPASLRTSFALMPLRASVMSRVATNHFHSGNLESWSTVPTRTVNWKPHEESHEPFPPTFVTFFPQPAHI